MRAPRKIGWIFAALAVLALPASACARRATPAECDQILDRYVDFTIDGDAELRKIPEETRGAARDVKKQAKRSSPEYARARDQCLREVSASQVSCAMKAGNSNEWEACVD
jgi:hypothetical protein